MIQINKMEEWVRLQSKEVQLEFFYQLTNFMSNSEIISVMEGVNSGRNIVDMHIELGLLERYSVEIPRIIELLKE
ncbi:MAG: hypothetical protein JXR64_02410 [Spirochaetales bacterium]|nr:hypothetical protein [Spirochaetales bacterium]